jgi:hypothetical protein
MIGVLQGLERILVMGKAAYATWLEELPLGQWFFLSFSVAN